MTSPVPSSDSRPVRRVLGLLALVCVVLQFPGKLGWSALALALWLAALAAFERPVLRRLFMPRFLAVTVAFALLSGLLLGRRDLVVAGLHVSSSGLRAGALMVVRGTFLWGLTAWGARLLSSGHLLGLGRRFAGTAFPGAVAVAIRLLPDLSEQLRRGWVEGRAARRGRVTTALHLAGDVVFEAARLAESLTTLHPAPDSAS